MQTFILDVLQEDEIASTQISQQSFKFHLNLCSNENETAVPEQEVSKSFTFIQKIKEDAVCMTSSNLGFLRKASWQFLVHLFITPGLPIPV